MYSEYARRSKKRRQSPTSSSGFAKANQGVSSQKNIQLSPLNLGSSPFQMSFAIAPRTKGLSSTKKLRSSDVSVSRIRGTSPKILKRSLNSSKKSKNISKSNSLARQQRIQIEIPEGPTFAMQKSMKGSMNNFFSTPTYKDSAQSPNGRTKKKVKKKLVIFRPKFTETPHQQSLKFSYMSLSPKLARSYSPKQESSILSKKLAKSPKKVRMKGSFVYVDEIHRKWPELGIPIKNSKVMKCNNNSVFAFGVNTHEGTTRKYNEDRVSVLLNSHKK